MTTTATHILHSLRSYVYTHIPTDGGWIVYCQGKLFMRRIDADDDTDKEVFCVEMDRCNLKVSPIVYWVPY